MEDFLRPLIPASVDTVFISAVMTVSNWYKKCMGIWWYAVPTSDLKMTSSESGSATLNDLSETPREQIPSRTLLQSQFSLQKCQKHLSEEDTIHNLPGNLSGTPMRKKWDPPQHTPSLQNPCQGPLLSHLLILPWKPYQKILTYSKSLV